MSYARSEVFGKTASLPLLPTQCDPFTVCCERVVQLVFRSFPEGIVLCVAVDWLPVIDIPKEEKYSLPACHPKPMRRASA